MSGPVRGEIKPPGPVARLARLALIAAIGWVGWSTFGGLGALFSRGPAPGAAAAAPALPADSAIAALAAPPPGYWTVPGWGWTWEDGEVPAAEVDGRLAALAQGEVRPLGGVAGMARLSRLVAAIGEGPARRGVWPGGAVATYAFDGAGLRARLIVREAGPDDGPGSGPALLGVGVALPSGSGGWRLVRLAPAPDGVAGRDGLPPLPAGARPACARWSHRGRLLLELSLLDASPADLRGAWERDGWAVEPTPGAGPSGFDVLARRGRDAVRAHGALDRGGAVRSLLLVRSPGEGP